jgi:hypothetical protein
MRKLKIMEHISLDGVIQVSDGPGKASGGCRLPGRERLRTGTCEWRDPMDLSGRTLSRPLPVSTSFRLSGCLF